jgi:pimeloyl-ACP methyl ester carboxylesterase
MSRGTTREVRIADGTLVYDEWGSGGRTVLLIHGLLLNRHMHAPLAGELAGRGYRVISLDLLGHGDSDRPRDMWRYSMPIFGRQVVAVMDELGLDKVVVGGTSLGANVSLEVASLAPDRLRGMVVEMPVLDNALLGCALAFTPLLVNLTFGAPIWNAVYRPAVRLIPRGLHMLGDTVRDWIDQDPGPSSAVVQGIFFGRVAPPREERRSLATKALVLGHPRDPIHPFSDADMLVKELPDARLVEANSLLELRVSPERLTGEISAFVDECWRPGGAHHDGTRRGAGAGPARSNRTRGTSA